MTDVPPPRFRLVLEPLPDPDGVPPVVRLRRALKHLLRACRLRCVSAVEETPLPQEEAAADDRPT